MDDQTDRAPELTTDQLLILWKQHEDIAMHFNELIARFRVQAAGAAATIGTLAAAVTKDGPDAKWLFAGMLFFLSIAWTALWQLDYRYYQKLLGGAVKSLLRLEARLDGCVALSTTVERQFRSDRFRGHFWFYSLIQAGLLILLAASLYRVWPTDRYFYPVPLAIAAWETAVVSLATPARKPH